MAIISITGLMGSGKSHQAVKGIIVPNYCKGRRILTNIKGFNIEELDRYCIEVLKKKKEDLGKVIIINDRDIRTTCELTLKELEQVDIDDPENAERLTSFYPYILDVNNTEVVVDKFSVVKAGDVVVIDEAGSFYKKVSEYDMEFFRMHRHFTNDDGLSCELCFMFQTKAMVHRDFFNLNFQVYQCKKLASLGLNNVYNLNIYDGSSMSRDTRITNEKAKYDKNIFPIYSSYAKGKGKEIKLDNRGALFTSPKFIGFVIMFVGVICFAVYATTSFFNPKKTKAPVSEQTTTQTMNSSSSPAPVHTPTPSSNLRITGFIDYPRKRLIIVQDDNMRYRIVDPQYCSGKGLSMVCKIDNAEVSYYSISRNEISLVGGLNENKNTVAPTTSGK